VCSPGGIGKRSDRQDIVPSVSEAGRKCKPTSIGEKGEPGRTTLRFRNYLRDVWVDVNLKGLCSISAVRVAGFPSVAAVPPPIVLS